MRDGTKLRAGPYPKDVRQCASCKADIVFVKTQRGKWMPVNVVPTDSQFRGPSAGETKYAHGEHQSHYATCTEPGRFRRRDE